MRSLPVVSAVAIAAASFGLLALSPAPVRAAESADCHRDCLLGIADRYMEALLAQEWRDLPWADRVRHTENDVGIQIGEGLWGTTTKIDQNPFRLADPATGNVLWYGVIEEHGDPTYLALRLRIEDARIAEVESVAARRGTPAHYAETEGYAVDAVMSEALPPAQRRPRERMIAIVEGWYNTVQLNDGQILGAIAGDCTRISNGVATSHVEGMQAQGCLAQLEAGYFKPVDSVRDRRFPIVDEERGIVVALALLDHAARYVEYETLDGETHSIPVEYPNSHRVMEMFKVQDGEVTHVEGNAVFQPYLMPSHW